jgi:hypothetical protein
MQFLRKVLLCLSEASCKTSKTNLIKLKLGGRVCFFGSFFAQAKNE